MKKISTQKHLLTGTSVFAVAALSVAVLPSQAFAAWGTITTPTTAVQAAAADTTTLTIDGTGSNTGDLAVAGGIAATNGNKIGTAIVVNAANTTTGISSTGNFSAIQVNGTGVITSLTNTKGLITGAGTGAATGTVFIDGADATTTIANSSLITNTGAGGVAINIGGTNVNKVTLNNTGGSILSTGGAASDAIDVADKATATFSLTNTGTITAGSSGNAIKIAAGGNTVATITNTSGTITGGVVLGANAGSTLAVNGGIIAGNVTLGQAGQVLTLGGGQVNGTIDGAGKIAVTQNYITAGNIGAGTPVTKVTVTDGKSLDLATNANSLSATNTVVGTAGAGATLTVGTGVITGAVDSGSAGTSTINFTKSNVLGVGTNIGAATGFATINIADGTTLNAATNNTTLKATNIYLGTTTGSTLNLGTGAITGALDSKTAGTGTLNFNGSQTNAATIGGGSGLAAINVADGATVVMNANATATTTKVGAGASGVLTLNAGKTVTGAVNINDGGILNQQTTSVITGVVNGVVANKGTYNVNTAGAFTTNNDIGATTGLAAFTVGDSVTATLSKNIKATTVTVGAGASGTATQTAGLITGNLAIASGATFTLNGGSGVTGTIDGAAGNVGTFALNSAFTAPSTIGAANGLAAINVGTGGTLNLGGNIKATTTTVSTGGTLNFGTTARTDTGALTGTGTGIINAGTKLQTVSGTLTTAATNTLGFAINSGTTNDSGRITAGTAALTTGTIVNLDTTKLASFVATGTRYLIVSDSAGTNNADDNAVALGTGNTNFLTFAQDRTVAGELAVKATRVAYESVATTRNGQAIGASLTALGAGSANAQVTAFQGRLDSTTTVAQANEVLAEVTPQIQATSVMSSNAVQKSLDVVSARGADLRAGIDNSITGMTAGSAVADKGIWAQAFGTTATQDTRSGVLGYDADTYGAAVGADMIVAPHTRAGVSVSYANTQVDGNGGVSQKTDIDTYQANLYGFHDMGQWYADGLLGFAWQNYNSDRVIVGTGTANGDYDGQTYTARANTGYRVNAGNGIQVIPNGGLTYINNQIDGYTETGAGGLNLKVNDYSSQALFGRVGLDVAKDFSNNGMIIRPTIRAAYLYDFIGDQADTTALFTGGGAAFRVSDADPERSSFNVGASLNIMTTANVTLSADYDYLVKSDYDSHSGMLRARFGF